MLDMKSKRRQRMKHTSNRVIAQATVYMETFSQRNVNENFKRIRLRQLSSRQMDGWEAVNALFFHS
jgi:hypothetical protein